MMANMSPDDGWPSKFDADNGNDAGAPIEHLIDDVEAMVSMSYKRKWKELSPDRNDGK